MTSVVPEPTIAVTLWASTYEPVPRASDTSMDETTTFGVWSSCTSTRVPIGKETGELQTAAPGVPASMLNAGPALMANEKRRPWKDGVALVLQIFRSPVVELGWVEPPGGMFVKVSLVRFSGVEPTGTSALACWWRMSVLRRRGAGSPAIALTWPVPFAASVTMFVPERVVTGPLHAPPLTGIVLAPFSENWKGLPLMPLSAAAQTSNVPVVVGVGPGG